MINWIIENIVLISATMCPFYVCLKLEKWHSERVPKKDIVFFIKAIKESKTITGREDETL